MVLLRCLSITHGTALGIKARRSTAAINSPTEIMTLITVRVHLASACVHRFSFAFSQTSNDIRSTKQPKPLNDADMYSRPPDCVFLSNKHGHLLSSKRQIKRETEEGSKLFCSSYETTPTVHPADEEFTGTKSDTDAERERMSLVQRTTGDDCRQIRR